MRIEINNLNFGFDSQTSIINNINLNLEFVDIVAIVGVSGSGKSTLLRLFSGLLLKEKKYNFQGSIKIDGLSPNEYRKNGKLSFMFQEAALLPHLSVFENIYFPLRIRGLNNQEKEINEMIDFIGLTSVKTSLPKTLSGGMKTRVALARSFITYPELLLLDEPFASLDVAWKAELYKELNMFRKKYKTTVLFVTHDIEEALQLADKVLVLGINGNFINEYDLLSEGRDKYEEIFQTIINDHKTIYRINNE